MVWPPPDPLKMPGCPLGSQHIQKKLIELDRAALEVLNPYAMRRIAATYVQAWQLGRNLHLYCQADDNQELVLAASRSKDAGLEFLRLLFESNGKAFGTMVLGDSPPSRVYCDGITKARLAPLLVALVQQVRSGVSWPKNWATTVTRTMRTFPSTSTTAFRLRRRDSAARRDQ